MQGRETRQKRSFLCKVKRAREIARCKQAGKPGKQGHLLWLRHTASCKEGHVGYLVDRGLRSLGQEAPVHAPARDDALHCAVLCNAGS